MVVTPNLAQTVLQGLVNAFQSRFRGKDRALTREDMVAAVDEILVGKFVLALDVDRSWDDHSISKGGYATICCGGALEGFFRTDVGTWCRDDLGYLPRVILRIVRSTDDRRWAILFENEDDAALFAMKWL